MAADPSVAASELQSTVIELLSCYQQVLELVLALERVRSGRQSRNRAEELKQGSQTRSLASDQRPSSLPAIFVSQLPKHL